MKPRGGMVLVVGFTATTRDVYDKALTSAGLRDLIKRCGGDRILDGTIVVPGEKRASFLVDAEALFVPLEVALVPSRRKQVYPVNRVRPDLP